TGDFIGSRAWTKHRDLITICDRGSREGGRARISSNQRNYVITIGKLFDFQTGDFGFRGVVLINQFQLFAEQTASIDLAERHVVSVLLCLPEPGFWSSKRSDDSHPDRVGAISIARFLTACRAQATKERNDDQNPSTFSRAVCE